MFNKIIASALIMLAVLSLNACTTVTGATSTTVQTTAQSAVTQAGATGTQTQSAEGSPQPPPDGQGGSTSASTTVTLTGVYSQSGGSVTKTGQAYTATGTDESAIVVTDAGVLTLTDATVTSSGNTSSSDNSSFYGQNAAILANAGSTINLSNVVITTTGTGANGAFASGTGSSVNLSNVTIDASGDGGHAVMATLGGTMTLVDVDMVTSNAHSGAVATDRGRGTITVTGGTVTTSGQDSPGIYSTGTITVTGTTITATGAEAAVIEGANTIDLTDTTLTSSKDDKWGVMIYQSMSGDAEGTQGSFTMSGGTLAYTSTSGPLFYVTNSTGAITLKGVDVTVGSGTLVKASAGNWGNNGTNGGNVILTAYGQTLVGNMAADNISTIAATLQNSSSLKGAINSENTAKEANLTLDASSTWDVTADSYLNCLSDANGISGDTVANISGNGHTVYYNQSACAELGGKTYNLNGGGYLKPA
jgi:hypothetical protein